MGLLLLTALSAAAGYCYGKYEPVVKAVLGQVLKK